MRTPLYCSYLLHALCNFFCPLTFEPRQHKITTVATITVMEHREWVFNLTTPTEFHMSVSQCTDGSIGTRVHPVAFRNESPTELWQRRPAQWRRLRWQNPLAGKDEYLIWEFASCECEHPVRATHTEHLATGEYCSPRSRNCRRRDAISLAESRKAVFCSQTLFFADEHDKDLNDGAWISTLLFMSWRRMY